MIRSPDRTSSPSLSLQTPHLSVVASSTWVITLYWLGLGSDMRKVWPPAPSMLSAMMALGSDWSVMKQLLINRN